MMTSSTKLIGAVALVAALLGGSIGGALVKSSRTPDAAATTATTTTSTAPSSQSLTADGTDTSTTTATTGTEQAKLDGSATSDASYRDGFEEGFRIAREGVNMNGTARSASPGRTRTRVVYRNGRPRTVASNGSRQAYYDYSEPRRSRSFWQKHRDKLTVAMGAGGGALIGGLIGGKKGAAIGALGGGGGSALYTYKLRKRNRNF
ncbi:MAG: hypothetical protein WCF57_19840 [Pyrinomonadaceae bacterium]